MELQIGSKVGFHGPYTVTKAAINMLAVQWHNELMDQGFTVVPLHVSPHFLGALFPTSHVS
jgi:NAD(P)-dependent dehydrogenase (short-subunit alcohol dehydrogenase family)